MPVNPVSAPGIFITGRSKAELLIWLSMLLVFLSISVLFSTSLCLDDT